MDNTVIVAIISFVGTLLGTAGGIIASGKLTEYRLAQLEKKVDMHNKVIDAYRRGEYQTVEGYVENFDPMPYGGKMDESFEINGVKFAYSDYNTQPGYNNAKSHGGVITGNGQHLKIGYVYLDEAYGNVIVYIEEIPE